MGSPGAGYARTGIGAGAGLGLLGYGLSQNPELQLTDPTQYWGGDQGAIGNQMGFQNSLNNNYLSQVGGQNSGLSNLFSNQNQTLQDAQQKYLTDQTARLGPNGDLGRTLAAQYNNSGLLNSGAFNEGLANSAMGIVGQNEQGLTNQITGQNQLQGQLYGGGLQQGYDTQSGLGTSGLTRQFGLEDQSSQTQLAQNLAKFIQQAGFQQALIGGGSNILGQTASGGGGK